MGKNDFDKFFKDVKKDMYKIAEKNAANSKLEITCPKCENKVKIQFKNSVGKCPKCNEKINLDLKWV
ncbi:hypothetical protein [Macrococcus armenti]|uniref:hypothetical protein n=1 Tax=Macrococcus armenti TaxID=2875764 RepID=UPI001CCE3397|nr:hypothetical protein [Macrococcus armenti]UBH14880.1 hypothetical protein LAU44_08930 [Macrococcus armenti]UBH17240.1 hypothetical protein LAU39_08960 [Macrococcus armenti]UBH19505.1 hypothetical protein LAU40_08940 [Macrococcus armenti]